MLSRPTVVDRSVIEIAVSAGRAVILYYGSENLTLPTLRGNPRLILHSYSFHLTETLLSISRDFSALLWANLLFPVTSSLVLQEVS